jgi:hypothetical protein
MGVYEKSLRVPIFFFFSLVHEEPWGAVGSSSSAHFFPFFIFLMYETSMAASPTLTLYIHI